MPEVRTIVISPTSSATTYEGRSDVRGGVPPSVPLSRTLNDRPSLPQPTP